MWKQLYDIFSGLFILSQKVERQDKEIATLRQEMKDLTALVHRLAFEVQRVNDREASAREKQQLWLENQLLKFKLQLPSGKPNNDDEEN